MPRLLERFTPVAASPPISPPRHSIHPWAWWGWAAAAAAAAGFTSSPLSVCLIAVAVVAVALRHHRGSSSMLRFSLALAAVIVVIRVLSRIVLGSSSPGTVIFVLPEVALPSWAAGIRLGGPVTSEELGLAATDALRLAILVLATGAAVTLADPRTALKSVPPALHDMSVAIVISLTLFPQLVSSARRIRRGRRLRGAARFHPGIIVAVVEDAVESSMALATSMEVRGFGRTRHQRPLGAPTAWALFGAVIALILGLFVLLGIPADGAPTLGFPATTWVGVALIGSGFTLGVVLLERSGRRLAVTRYRPAPWTSAEWTLLSVALTALAAAVTLGGSGLPGSLLAPVLLMAAIFKKVV